VIQRAYEEGEEQLLESDDDDIDNGTFHLFPTFSFYPDLSLMIIKERRMRNHFYSMKAFTYAALSIKDVSSSPGETYLVTLVMSINLSAIPRLNQV
jgi:hypothetical protein